METELRWLELDDGSALAIDEGKLVARNKKGKRLKAPSKKMKDSERGQELLDVIALQKAHAQSCLETVETWMLRSLPVPTRALVATWPDPAWRRLLEHTVVAPAPGTPEADDPDLVGMLRDVDADKGLGLVNLDGETVWAAPETVVIPHPILLDELSEWRGMMADLGVAQGLAQLARETFAKPDGLDPTLQNLDTYNGAQFEQLNHAIGRARAIGCRVSGGFAVTSVWEEGVRYRALFWIGAEDPFYETVTGDLMWTDAEEKAVRVAKVPPVAYSEGVRMAALIHAARKVEDEDEAKS